MTDRSTHVITAALRAHGAAKLGVSFNGGKDSVVMLYRVLDVAGLSVLREMTIFNLLEHDEFEEMRQFRCETAAALGLTVHNYPGASSRDAMEAMLLQKPLEGVFIGTRDGDPNAKYQSSDIAPTSNGWPACMLYCPIMTWTYQMVWDYTLSRQLPVCSMYARGYTSIGSPRTTVPNPHLLLEPEGEAASASEVLQQRFRAAWELNDGSLERAGRAKPSTL